ncbi:MAG: hypothetical protein NZM39_12420, partial [Bernardetiaceae bacterium]|nr:hypothetical protein [Bernardetiaceae bacterium]
ILRIEGYLKPPFTFVRHYIIHQGFLDGKAGFHIARISAQGVCERYAHALRLKNKNSPRK